MLPQNRGFLTIEATEDLAEGDGGGAAAALAARSAAESASDYPQHRPRRSVGESTMPKVYGQVM